MAKVVVVTSGKGGVGKTTTTAALGAALAQIGQKVVIVDFDVGLRNLDLVMGAERRVVYDLINVIQGIAKLQQALIRDKRVDTLALLPASQTRDKDALTEDGVRRVIAQLRQMVDWVICDSPAGIERGATLAMRFADIAVIVTNPEVSSVRDSDRIIGLLDAKTLKAERGERIDKHLLITRYDQTRAARGEMLGIDDVLEILAIPLLGIVPESELETYGSDDSRLPMSGMATYTPGMEISGGSLGQGLAIGVGMALGLKQKKNRAFVYNSMSDGELDEGSTWEAAMGAAHHRLDNLICLVDINNQQADGPSGKVLGF